MLTNALWLAQAETEGGTSFSGLSAGTREVLILFGALLLVTLLVVIWAAAIRKRHHTRHSHHHHRTRELPDSHQGETASLFSTHRHRRRRRREHRPRNPTLAETSGLPPLRADEPTSSQPQT